MSIRPLTYSQLPHQQVLLNNLVCGLSGQLQTQLGSSTCQISLYPITTTRQFDLQFTLEVDGLPVRIQVSRDLFAEMAVGGSPMADLLEQLPDELRMGCASMVVDRLLGDLRSLIQKDVRLSKISRCEHLPDGTPALGIAIQLGNRTSNGLLILNDQLTTLLHNLATTAEPAPPADLLMPLPVEVGYTKIADTRLARMSTGDIVLFDRCWHKDRQHVFLRMSASSGFLGRLDGNRITLEQQVKNTMSDDDFDDFDLDDDLDLGDDFDDDLDEIPQAQAAPAAQPEAPQQAAAAPAQAPQAQAPSQQVTHADIQGLPVKLMFDIGNHEITVGDMGRLSPGYTFELNRDTASPVTMKANGKPFAECELVQINNQLGARIVRLI
ncbi:type III secretion system cytoplasmic ring protein SctQ [Sansalvadorimonas sp. 2012CJ34-2]|uniref:Type III secretion system cytoplasmic ring protein SctQ n=1 Tax=Parendozoicomonas callyspongiae TaxID=2942213 RepID=A0ABT0PK46_9GAMM|nr:type III secretion system cytoplasmic ring protein SctQ [Sansalvadorimonas sp. 2012CJ34-2]MCL6271703.1 type III secretion system cytoplasmic ring protein SctQ [Sansalvadorimonas sp. 2012CJ34-2]